MRLHAWSRRLKPRLVRSGPARECEIVARGYSALRAGAFPVNFAAWAGPALAQNRERAPSQTKAATSPPTAKDSMRSIVATFTAAACTAFACVPARAADVYVGVGSTGVELGYALKLAPSTGLHVDAEFLNLKRSFEDNGATYDTRLKFAAAGVYGDLFLTDSFRFTGGAVIGSRKITGTGVSSGGTITVNGVGYMVAAGETVTVDAKFPSVAPYLGLGFGHGGTGEGLGFYCDFGAVFGKPKVKLTPSAGLLALAGQANVDAEQAKLQDKMNKLRAYPVIKLGLSYGF
jgi:hypothetical protein